VRYKGKISNWNAERGFGFITPAEGGERVFLHITAISDRRRPPADGDLVTYDLAFDERKRPRAVSVRPSMLTQPRSPAARASTSGSVAMVVALLFVLFLIGETLAGALPLPVIATYGAFSFLTFLMYWFDKAAARQGRWRATENSLLFIGLACGWPGAVVAQRVLRHKSRKGSFQVAFWGTVVVNSVALGWLLTNSGSKFLEQLLR
jgi:uncharacterized membrane protein YsdA (DUF1294 family)/cold shock CspA family protein